MATVAEIRQKRLPEGGSYPEEAWDRLMNSLDRDLAEIKSVGSAIVPEVDYKGCYSVLLCHFSLMYLVTAEKMFPRLRDHTSPPPLAAGASSHNLWTITEQYLYNLMTN